MNWVTAVHGHVNTVTTFERCRVTFADVPGFLHDVEGFTLLMLAAMGPGHGEIVEIGSFKGRSTCFLAFGAKSANRGMVTAIDPFTGSPEHQAGGQSADPDIVKHGSTFAVFLDTLQRKGFSDRVRTLRMASEQAAAQWQVPIRLLFIDGDHSYAATRTDFTGFERFIEPGGVVCFHDIGTPIGAGCTAFLNELVTTNPSYKLLFQTVSLAVVVKSGGTP